MFIDYTNGIKLNNLDITPYIIDVEYQYNKLWNESTGRTLSGKMSGRLLGIFPKIIIQFRPLTKSELNTLAPIFDSATQSLRYYDPKKNQYITITTYSNDWSIKNINVMQNEPFSVSFIAMDKRS